MPPVPAIDALSDLKRLEIDPSGPAPTLAEARAACWALATGHYENFSVLTRLVPARLRDDFAAVYAYCRWSDDLADETGQDEAARERSLGLLARWREMLTSCERWAASGPATGSDRVAQPADQEASDAPAPPRHWVFIALADTMRRHRLPGEPFHHLLDAFVQDQRVTRYQTWEEVVDYCTRSADPVGRIILCLAGTDIRDPANAHLVKMSDATCTALQLTNFWQDVRRDLIERDRVYLPLAEVGFDADTLRRWAQTPDDSAARVAFIRAVRPLVERTRSLFVQGRPLPRELGRELGPVVWLFGRGGEAVLTSVERAGCATLWSRPTLGKVGKAWLVAKAAILVAFGAFGGPPRS